MAMEDRETFNLIGSDNVEGTNVYGPDGQKVGYLARVMIDKVSGKVSYAVLSFGDLFVVSATITTRCIKMGRHTAQIWQRHGFIACSSRDQGPNANPFPQLPTANCSGQVIWLSHAAA